MQGYWNRILERQVSRRRAIAATGASALGAAFLAACGGSDSGSSGGGGGGGKEAVSGLLTKPVDTTKQAKRGGILKRNVAADPTTLDPMQNAAPAVPFTETIMGRLVGFKPGFNAPAQEDQVDGDIAESWEISPDHLTMTFKMRPGVKWHPVAPVNSRAVDVDDVLFTWDRFSKQGNQRGGVANSANPNAPVLGVTAPDAKTIVVKLKFPVVYALSMFGARENVNVMPKEAGSGGYEPRGKMIGTGPYYVAEHNPSSNFVLKRHPDFYNKDALFADQIDYPIIPEYATQMAQFRTGNIYVASGGTGSGGTGLAIKQEEVLQTKKDLPQLNMYFAGIVSTGNKLIFGWKTPALRDERVRQAFSLSYDRDTWIEVWNNASKFEAAGVPVERRWFGSLPSLVQSYDGWRVEPRDEKAYGPNAKYFKHDVAEAKKLLAAAGFPNGVDMKSWVVKGNDYGITFQKEVEIRQGMNAEAGIRLTNNLLDYQTEFIPQIRDVNGNFEGIGYRSGPPATSADPVGQYTFFYYSKAGISFYGFDANGKGDNSGDPFVDDSITKAQQEFDTEKRRALVQNLDKYIGGKMYSVNGLGGASGFSMTWPILQNYRVWQGGSANSNRIENMYWWLDDTKK